MTRRFSDKDRWKAFRKLDLSLKQLYDYCWDMADAIGVYEVDYDYLRLDTGIEYTHNDFFSLINSLPEGKKVAEIAPGKFLFIDFIEVVYEKLKEGYNPHKPAFRALAKHQLEINSSLNQAYLKLVKEKEYIKEKEKENNIKKECEIFEAESLGPANEITEIEVSPTFDDFWQEYDKKKGSIEKLKPKWEKLSQNERELIMEYIPNYKFSQPDKQYRLNPETFLNNKSWNDELIFKTDRKPELSGKIQSIVNQTEELKIYYASKQNNG